MKTLKDIQHILQLHKKELTTKYGLKSIGIFGSYSRGDQKESSDVDILIDYERPMGIEFIDLADELEALLSRKVDLVSRKAVKPKAFSYIEKDLIYV